MDDRVELVPRVVRRGGHALNRFCTSPSTSGGQIATARCTLADVVEVAASAARSSKRSKLACARAVAVLNPGFAAGR